MDPAQLCGTLDALMGNKDTQDEITKVQNHEEL